MDDMNYKPCHNPAVSLAYSVIEMHEEIMMLRREVMRLQKVEEDFHEFLNKTQSHHEAMLGSMLTAVMGGKELSKAGNGN